MSIPFTQYLMPDGRRSQVLIDRSPEIEARARRIIDLGYRFEIEMLSDYASIHMTITNDEHGDVASEIVTNGPAVPEAVDRMICGFRGVED